MAKRKKQAVATHRPMLTEPLKKWMFAIILRNQQVFEEAVRMIKMEYFSQSESWLALVWRAAAEHFQATGEMPTERAILTRCSSDLSLNPDLITEGDDKKIKSFVAMTFSLAEEDIQPRIALTSLQQFLEDRHMYVVADAVSMPQTPLNLPAVLSQLAEEAATFSTIGKPPKFPIIAAAELAAGDYRLTYIVEQLLVEDQFCVIGGPKKSLKTSLAIVLAICIALGVPFLGQFCVNGRRRVLVCTCEAGLGAVKSTARRICASLEVELESISDLAFCPNVPKLDDPASWADFTREVKRFQPDVLVLDPFYRMFGGDGAENLFRVAVPLDLVENFCRAAGITPILCHHLKSTRANPYSPADLDDLAYAGISEFARQWALVTRREPYEVGSGLHSLLLSTGGSAGHNSMWALDVDEGVFDSDDAAGDGLYGRHWHTCLRPADEARADAQQRKADDKASAKQEQQAADVELVENALRGCPEQLGTITDLKNRSGLNTNRFGAALAVLLREGRFVSATVVKRNNREYDCFAFSPEECNSRNGTHPDSASG